MNELTVNRVRLPQHVDGRSRRTDQVRSGHGAAPSRDAATLLRGRHRRRRRRLAVNAAVAVPDAMDRLQWNLHPSLRRVNNQKLNYIQNNSIQNNSIQIIMKYDWNLGTERRRMASSQLTWHTTCTICISTPTSRRRRRRRRLPHRRWPYSTRPAAASAPASRRPF